MEVNGEHKYVIVGMDTAFDSIELLHITDVQYGHVNCLVDRFLEYRDWILSAPNRFALFGGDMVDAATKVSVGSPWENTKEPKRQIKEFCALARPMASRVLAYVGGNHERRTTLTFGDATSIIAEELDIPYSSGLQYVDINYGCHKPFRIALWHGGGNGQTKGSKAMMIHKFMDKSKDADLCMVGHLHDTLLISDTRIGASNGDLTLKKRFGVMSSSFLGYFGSYAEVAGLAPSSLNMWRVVLTPDGKSELTLR